MYFTTSTALTAALVAAGLASAQKVHVVSVSTSKGDKIFTPDNLKADAGDMIQFQFLAGNHSVVQSNFDNPCTPIQGHVANATGMFSGYMDVQASAGTGMIPVYTVQVADKKPLWLYCSQGKHCQAGMVMVVNENTNADASRSLDAFKKLAAAAPQNLDPTTQSGVGSGNTPDSAGTPIAGTTSSIPSPTGSPSPSGSATPPGSAGVALSAPVGAGLFGLAAAALMLL